MADTAEPTNCPTQEPTVTATILEDRLAKITTLKGGSHNPNDGVNACVMEAVAYVAGEPWSDHPECTCPVITAFMVSWNDGLPSDADRARLLLPLIPKLIGTRGSKALEGRRANMATDWYIRVQTPAWLRLAGLTKQADALAGFPEITDFSQVPALMPTLEAVRTDAAAAWAAARAAAGAAARAAAGDAARAAAGAAAWAAAWDAAGAAAWDTAGAAAGDAAGAAAWAALSPTVAALQLSAVELVERMCALHDEAS